MANLSIIAAEITNLYVRIRSSKIQEQSSRVSKALISVKQLVAWGGSKPTTPGWLSLPLILHHLAINIQKLGQYAGGGSPDDVSLVVIRLYAYCLATHSLSRLAQAILVQKY